MHTESAQRKISIWYFILDKSFRLRCNLAHYTTLLLHVLVLGEDWRWMLNILTEIAHFIISKALIELYVSVALDISQSEAWRHELSLLTSMEGVSSWRCKLGHITVLHEALLCGVWLVECLVIFGSSVISIVLIVFIHDKDMLMVLLFLKIFTQVWGRLLLSANSDNIFFWSLCILLSGCSRSDGLIIFYGYLSRANLAAKTIKWRSYALIIRLLVHFVTFIYSIEWWKGQRWNYTAIVGDCALLLWPDLSLQFFGVNTKQTLPQLGQIGHPVNLLPRLLLENLLRIIRHLI